MNECLTIIVLLSAFILLIATSRLTFVKTAIYYGWIDRSKKITSSDYIGNFDGDWVGISIDYKGLLSAHPNDSILREYVKEIRILKTISVIAVSIISAVIILGTIVNLGE